MRHDTEIGAWKRRWSWRRPRRASKISPAGLFDIPFVCHVFEFAYVRRLYELFQKYRKRSTERKVLTGYRCVASKSILDKFYLVHDAADWWCKRDFERRQ